MPTTSLPSTAVSAGFKVDDGVSVCYHSDRKAATVIKVSPSGKTVTVQFDVAVRSDKRGMDEHQEYTYHRNLAERVMTFRKTGRGYCAAGGSPRLVKGRMAYHDYSF